MKQDYFHKAFNYLNKIDIIYIVAAAGCGSASQYGRKVVFLCPFNW